MVEQRPGLLETIDERLSNSGLVIGFIILGGELDSRLVSLSRMALFVP